MSKAWAKGSTRAWRKRRALVLADAGYRCQIRTEHCTIMATQVHHVYGKGRDEAALVAACQPCNNAIGDPTRHDPAPTPRTAW